MSAAFEKDQLNYDGSVDVLDGQDGADTLNEISISQAVLEEAPLPDNMDRKRQSMNTMIEMKKDYPLSA